MLRILRHCTVAISIVGLVSCMFIGAFVAENGCAHSKSILNDTVECAGQDAKKIITLEPLIIQLLISDSPDAGKFLDNLVEVFGDIIICVVQKAMDDYAQQLTALPDPYASDEASMKIHRDAAKMRRNISNWKLDKSRR